MAKIIDKIKSRPLFFTYIFLTEISYLMILMDFLFQFSYFHETRMCRVTCWISSIFSYRTDIFCTQFFQVGNKADQKENNPFFSLALLLVDCGFLSLV